MFKLAVFFILPSCPPQVENSKDTQASCSKHSKHSEVGVGAHSTMDTVLAWHPAAPGLILRIPKSFSDNLERNNSMLQRRIDGPA